jgi:hypothetical protein
MKDQFTNLIKKKYYLDFIGAVEIQCIFGILGKESNPDLSLDSRAKLTSVIISLYQRSILAKESSARAVKTQLST